MKRAVSNKLQQLQTWIGGIETAMLTTEDRLGHLRSRPMIALDATPDDALWFFSDASSAKIDDIHGHHNVSLSYSDPASARFVSVTGRARIVRDRAQMKELWNGKLKNWFSKGPDDPEIVLLRVELFEAELWQAGERAVEVKLEVSNETRNTHETLTFA